MGYLSKNDTVVQSCYATLTHFRLLALPFLLLCFHYYTRCHVIVSVRHIYRGFLYLYLYLHGRRGASPSRPLHGRQQSPGVLLHRVSVQNVLPAAAAGSAVDKDVTIHRRNVEAELNDDRNPKKCYSIYSYGCQFVYVNMLDYIKYIHTYIHTLKVLKE